MSGKLTQGTLLLQVLIPFTKRVPRELITALSAAQAALVLSYICSTQRFAKALQSGRFCGPPKYVQAVADFTKKCRSVRDWRVMPKLE